MNAHTPEKQKSLRGNPTEENAWCWQDKTARRLIREKLDGTQFISATLSIYDALTEIASDAGTATFTTTHAWIGMIAGSSAKTAMRQIPALVEIGLISIAENKPGIRGPNTYLLLSLRDSALGQGVQTLGQGVPTLGQSRKQASCPPSEEPIKEPIKERTEEGACAPALSKKRLIYPTLEVWTAKAHADHPDWPINDAQSAWEHYEKVGWRTKSAPIVKWEMCVATCYRNWKTRAASGGSPFQPQAQQNRIPDNVRAHQLGITVDEFRQKRTAGEITA